MRYHNYAHSSQILASMRYTPVGFCTCSLEPVDFAVLSVYCVHVYHRELAPLLTWPETLYDLHSHYHQYHICTKKKVIIKETKRQQRKWRITRILLTELWIASPGSSVTCLSQRWEKRVRKTVSRALYHSIISNCSIPAPIFLCFVILYWNTTNRQVHSTTHRDVPSFDICTILFCYFFLTSCLLLKRFSWILPPKDTSQLKLQSAFKSS